MSVYCTRYHSYGLVLKTRRILEGFNLRCLSPCLVLIIINFWCLCIVVGTATGQRLVPDINQKTIVLDPGHGGNDMGAKGPQGTYEKDVTLTVAQSIAARLKNRYRVILTRSGDYDADVFDRTAVANHQKADLFISIHTGADFLHKTDGISIFTYQENDGGANPMPPLEPLTDIKTKIPWNYVQLRHKTDSKQLAKTIYDRLCSAQPSSKCKIRQAPLLVLMGADMPSVLLEIGYITNPQDEIMMSHPEELSWIVTAISQGIDNFLATYDPQTPQ